MHNEPAPHELLAAILTLNEAVSRGFDRQDAKFDGLDQRMTSMESRLTKVEGELHGVKDELAGVKQWMVRVDKRFDAIAQAARPTDV